MPRPNRYSPYPRHPSPRFMTTAKAPDVPQLPFSAMPSPEPELDQHKHRQHPHQLNGYQYIAPGHIRGRTPDGRALAAKNIFLAPDGTYHVQMEVISFPSQDARLQHGIPTPPSQVYTPLISSPPMASSPPMTHFDPTLHGLGVQTGAQTQQRKGSAGSVVSHDGRSVRSVSEESAALTDEDAEGELDDEECRRLAVMQQQRILADLKAKGVTPNLSFDQ